MVSNLLFYSIGGLKTENCEICRGLVISYLFEHVYRGISSCIPCRPFPLRPSPYSLTLEPSARVQDVLRTLAAQFRLSLWAGYPQYVLRLSQTDAVRLKLSPHDLPLDTIIASLGVEQLELVKRECVHVLRSDVWQLAECTHN